MKKILCYFFCLISVCSFSQIKIGVQGGYNISKITNMRSNAYISTTSVNNFQLGAIAEITFKKNIFFQSGLNITGKGGFIGDHSIADGGSETTTKLWYLQIPINFGGKISLGKNMQAIVGMGLYIARGVSGTEKGTGSGFGGSYPINYKIHFTNDANYYKANTTTVKPFDFGYNALAGVEYKKLQFTFNYSHGFGNVYPYDYATFKNQVFNFSLAYFFLQK